MKFRMFVAGPDDIQDFDNEIEALRTANEVNKKYLQDRADHPDSEVLCVAVVREAADDA